MLKNSERKTTEGGFIALTSVLIIGAVVLVLGISLFHSALTDYSISTAYESGQEAAFLADFCLKEGVLRLKEDIDYKGGEDIKVNGKTCYIGPVEDINENTKNTKKVSSLGRSGEQPHFSRASQLVRYIIEPREEGWLIDEEKQEGADWEKVEEAEVAGNSLLELTRPEAEVITRTIDSYDDWSDYYDNSADNVDFTEDGSLILAETAAPPPPSLDCGTTTASSIEIKYKFSNASDVSLYRNSLEIARLGSGTRSDSFFDTGLSPDTSYIYTLKDEGIDLAAITCSTEYEIKKADGESCENGSECQLGNCQNNICCAQGQRCCSSDDHCDADSCDGICTKIDNYCDTTTDHYCKIQDIDCENKYKCSSGSCISGSCDTSPTCDKKCSNGSCVHQSSSEDLWSACSSQQSSCPATLLNQHSGSCNTVCGNLSYRTGNCNGSGGCETGCTCYEIGTDSGGTNGHYCSYICKAHLGCRCTSGQTGSCSSNLSNKSHSCECEGRTYEANWTFCRCK